MSILVTGGAGFIGSNFVKYLMNNTDHHIINLDLLTYAGNLKNIEDILESDRHIFVKGDICNRSLIDELFKKYDIGAVVNFAAESHVDRSVDDPEIFLRTNVLGTHTLLDTAKRNWKLEPFNKYDKGYKKGVRFIQVSTDEVYGSLSSNGSFTELTPLAPNSPYSSSKASADMLVRAYKETFGFPAIITRCSNNYGPYQFPEKFIPLIINNALKGQKIPVYGDGKQIRDWLHVEDHCKAVYTVLTRGNNGEIYNIGGKNEKENIEIVKLILHYMGKSDKLITYVQDRPGHDRRYAIDNTKISKELGWNPSYLFEDGLYSTIEWYVNHKEWLDGMASGDYLLYYEKMYAV